MKNPETYDHMKDERKLSIRHNTFLVILLIALLAIFGVFFFEIYVRFCLEVI